MLFVHNTSRVEGEPYGKLLSEKGFNAFPTLCFMDAEGNVLFKQGERSVEAFQKSQARGQALLDLRKQAAGGGGAEVQKKLFLTELDLGLLSVEQIGQRAKTFTLSKDEQAKVDGKLTDAEVAAVLAKARELGQDGVAKALLAILESGRQPSEEMGQRFWVVLLGHASSKKDAALADRAYGELERRVGKEARFQKALEGWQKLRDAAHAK